MAFFAATAACGAAAPPRAQPPTLAYAVVAAPEPKPASEDLTSAIDDVRTEPDVKAEDDRRIADGVPDANLSAVAVASGVVAIADVSCHADDGIGALPKIATLAKPFADRRKLLDRCAKGHPHVARVRWTAVGGRMTDVEVISGEDPSNRCIARALVGARVPVAGRCAATVEVGAQRR